MISQSTGEQSAAKTNGRRNINTYLTVGALVIGLLTLRSSDRSEAVLDRINDNVATMKSQNHTVGEQIMTISESVTEVVKAVQGVLRVKSEAFDKDSEEAIRHRRLTDAIIKLEQIANKRTIGKQVNGKTHREEILPNCGSWKECWFKDQKTNQNR